MTARQIGGLSVSRETFERLETYAKLVRKWNPKINLVSKRSLEQLWTRHFVDSAQVFRLADNTKNWVDIGSGGGFPGLVIAMLLAEFKPESQVTLIESDQRKSAFLRTVGRETGIRCRVICDRVEKVEPQAATVLTARALAELSTLLAYAERHMAPDGVAIFPKGTTWKKEVKTAQQEWSFDFEAIKSLTEPEAAILKIKGVSRV